MNACYTINRKKHYFKIFNTNEHYPLDLVNDYKKKHGLTYQQFANQFGDPDSFDPNPENAK